MAGLVQLWVSCAVWQASCLAMINKPRRSSMRSIMLWSVIFVKMDGDLPEALGVSHAVLEWFNAVVNVFMLFELLIQSNKTAQRRHSKQMRQFIPQPPYAYLSFSRLVDHAN